MDSALFVKQRFAVSRDLYDIYNLISTGIDMNAVKQILPGKFELKRLSLKGIDIKILEKRRSEFETDWDRRLHYLVINKGLNFETVWQYVLQFLKELTINIDLGGAIPKH